MCLTFLPKMRLIRPLVSEEFDHIHTHTQTDKQRTYRYYMMMIGLLLSHFWLLSCLSYTSYILSIYILPIHFTYHQFYILLQSSNSLFEEPSSHRCRGRSNLGSDLRIWGRRCYNPEGYNRRHRSICELPCCWITLTTLHVIHQLHIIAYTYHHYYTYTHCSPNC